MSPRKGCCKMLGSSPVRCESRVNVELSLISYMRILRKLYEKEQNQQNLFRLELVSSLLRIASKIANPNLYETVISKPKIEGSSPFVIVLFPLHAEFGYIQKIIDAAEQLADLQVFFGIRGFSESSDEVYRKKIQLLSQYEEAFSWFSGKMIEVERGHD